MLTSEKPRHCCPYSSLCEGPKRASLVGVRTGLSVAAIQVIDVICERPDYKLVSKEVTIPLDDINLEEVICYGVVVTRHVIDGVSRQLTAESVSTLRQLSEAHTLCNLYQGFMQRLS